MKITIRLIVSLLLVAAGVAFVFTYLQVQSEREILLREFDARAGVVGESLEESIAGYFRANAMDRLRRFVDRFGRKAQLIGVAVYDSQGTLLVASRTLSGRLPSTPDQVWECITRSQPVSELIGNTDSAHVAAFPVEVEGRLMGAIFLYQDASYIDARLDAIWRSNFIRLLAQTFLIIVTTIIVVRWSITGPIAQITQWMRGLRTGKSPQLMVVPRGDILAPLTTEVTLMAKSLSQARASAREKARVRVEGESLWTSGRLREHVHVELGGRGLYIVSNREPYMHMNQGSSVECIMPAGGLVTALDPILRSCGGLWIAHGSGTADRETVDERGCIAVPPNEPRYTLRRIFLSKEEEEGYYYGFSNEGIWPLCHITHTRPVFSLNSWIEYQRVNEKFADALLEEIHKEESPLVLIQDYHFALLPLLIKAKRPDARVAIFWHIPWPNPEVFGICPWKQELLFGLLSADLIGFHTQFHCNNFLETVDRFLESKVNWDNFSVERHGQLTLVRPFPISVAPPAVVESKDEITIDASDRKRDILKKLGIISQWLLVGVDRIDYTKGILERFRAIQRFLEKYPEYQGKLTFVELGAPSRTHIKRYHDLMGELEETVDRINWPLQTKNWKPIVFLKAHHTHDIISQFYQAADICMVTSLHDGMNLVAKEFVASRKDMKGVLILSQFAGAAQELRDALVVNPYDVEEMADSIHQALTMNPKEVQERMERLSAVVKERNVYRWAANIVTTLARVRIPKATAAVEQ